MFIRNSRVKFITSIATFFKFESISSLETTQVPPFKTPGIIKTRALSFNCKHLLQFFLFH